MSDQIDRWDFIGIIFGTVSTATDSQDSSRYGDSRNLVRCLFPHTPLRATDQPKGDSEFLWLWLSSVMVLVLA